MEGGGAGAAAHLCARRCRPLRCAACGPSQHPNLLWPHELVCCFQPLQRFCVEHVIFVSKFFNIFNEP